MECRSLIDFAEILSRNKNVKEAIALLRQVEFRSELSIADLAYLYSKLINILLADGDIGAAEEVIVKAQNLMNNWELPDYEKTWLYDSFAFYENRKEEVYNPQVIYYLELASEQCMKSKDTLQRGYIQYSISRYYSDYEMWDEVATYLFDTESIADHFMDSTLQQVVYTQIGNYYNNYMKDAQALYYFIKGLALCESSENKDNLGHLYKCVGISHFHLFEMTDAAFYWEKGLALAIGTGDKELRQTMLDYLECIPPKNNL